MISATVLTKNSERLIADVLKSLEFCDEVVVLDSGSTDNTLKIAAAYKNVNIHIHEGEFLGFGKMHQKASSLAKHDWILSIDSDEIVTPELANEIKEEKLNVEVVYAIASKNFFHGTWIYSCGWYPDYKLRLFNKVVTDFDDKMVHENIKTEGLKIKKLKNHLHHYSYNSSEDFIIKMQKYSDYYAKEYYGRKESSPFKAIYRGTWAFFRSYILQKGILQGGLGFAISAYNAQTTFWKYIKLYEANKV